MDFRYLFRQHSQDPVHKQWQKRKHFPRLQQWGQYQKSHTRRLHHHQKAQKRHRHFPFVNRNRRQHPLERY